MLSQVITRELLEQSLIDGFKMFYDAVMPVVEPYIITAIISAVAVGFIKIIVGRFAYDLSILTGYTHRQAKRKSQKAKNTVELASSVSNINNSLNKYS